MQRSALPSRQGFAGLIRLLAVSALIAVAVFSTTYRVANVLLYPRLMCAMGGLLLVAMRRDLRPLAWPALWLLPCAAIAFMACLVHQFWDDLALFISLLIRGILVPYFSVIFLGWVLNLFESSPRHAVETRFLLTAVFVAIGLQFGVTALHLLNAEAKTTFLSYLNLSDTWRSQADGGHFRYSGIGGISLYDTALAYCLMIALLLLPALQAPEREVPTWIRSAAMACVIFLTLIHGRTGLTVALVLLIILSMRDILTRVSPLKMVPLQAMLIVGAFAIVLFDILDEELRDLILGFAGEMFMNFDSGQGLRSESTDDFLENHLRMPNPSTWFIGSGEWAQPDVAETRGSLFTTDSGYLLILQFGGLVMLLAVGTMLFAAMQRLTGKIGTGGLRARRKSRLFIVFLTSVFALLSWKGPIFLSEHCMTALFLVMAIWAFTQRSSPNRTLAIPRAAPALHG